jgi:hypothetical protein
VAGEQHGDPLRDARSDQVARGRASAIVQQAVRHLGLPRCQAPQWRRCEDGEHMADSTRTFSRVTD